MFGPVSHHGRGLQHHGVPWGVFGDVDAKPGFLQLDVVRAGAWPRSAVRASFGTSGHASQCTLFSAWHLRAIWLIRAFQVR